MGRVPPAGSIALMSDSGEFKIAFGIYCLPVSLKCLLGAGRRKEGRMESHLPCKMVSCKHPELDALKKINHDCDDSHEQ